jgi:YidC/Oxa1 family membrane protein insertase
MNFGFFEIFATGLAGFYSIIQSYGLAIILLTLAVRVLLLPLSIKQTRSMREMQVIQPEIKRIQAKHKGDRTKMNEEMMALYKEHGVNPFGGCAPLLLQFPVLIGLFYVIKSPLNYMDSGSLLAGNLMERALEVNTFLGIRLDCYPSQVFGSRASETIPDVACGSGLLSFLPYLALILFMGFTTFYQQKQMQAQRQPGDPQMAQMQMFLKIMPIMLMFFAFNFPTGVVLYWVTTNAWTIIQQRIILKAAPLVPAGSGGNGKLPGKTIDTKAVKASEKPGPNGAGSKPAAATGASKRNPSSKKKKRR